MEEVHNDLETGEMHSEDDRVLAEKNKKRTVKTPAQVEALEKFYNEHKYPTEAMKIQVADSIGLTEKQVSGWFCHRRLKDKKLMNVDNCVAGKQDRSSGVIQDIGSGHRQDSCSSTKLVDDRNLNTREVESGMLTHPQNYTVEFQNKHGGRYVANYNQTDGASSGSSSSLRNLSIQCSEKHFDVVTSRHLAPKFPMDVLGAKPRSGPSGYLKVKRQVENSAVTAVKRQLGKQYQEDGPPLSVEFDPLPPGAFESSMPNQIDETCHTEDTASPASPDNSQTHKPAKFVKGCEYNTSMTSLNSKLDRTSLNAPQGIDLPDYYDLQKPNNSSSLPRNGSYHSLKSPEVSTANVPGGENQVDYGTRYRQGVEDMRVSSVLNSCCQQPFRGNIRAEQGSNFQRYGEVSRKNVKGENIENVSSILAMKGSENDHALDKMWSRSTPKDGKNYAERKMTNENQASKRTWDGYCRPPPLKKPSIIDHPPVSFRPIRFDIFNPETNC